MKFYYAKLLSNNVINICLKLSLMLYYKYPAFLCMPGIEQQAYKVPHEKEPGSDFTFVITL